MRKRFVQTVIRDIGGYIRGQVFELVTGIPHCDARVYALKHFDIVFRVAECECVVYVSAAAIEIFFNSAGFVDSARRNLPACIAEIAEAVSDNIEFIAYILLQLGKINTPNRNISAFQYRSCLRRYHRLPFLRRASVNPLWCIQAY